MKTKNTDIFAVRDEIEKLEKELFSLECVKDAMPDVTADAELVGRLHAALNREIKAKRRFRSAARWAVAAMLLIAAAVSVKMYSGTDTEDASSLAYASESFWDNSADTDTIETALDSIEYMISYAESESGYVDYEVSDIETELFADAFWKG
jgi:hypothetical protein